MSARWKIAAAAACLLVVGCQSTAAADGGGVSGSHPERVQPHVVVFPDGLKVRCIWEAEYSMQGNSGALSCDWAGATR